MKKQKAKKIFIKKLKFEDYSNCLEVPQIKDKINHSKKSKTDVDSLKKNHKEFIKNNKLMLKTQQRFRNEKHNVFTENINKIALSSDYYKRMQ